MSWFRQVGWVLLGAWLAACTAPPNAQSDRTAHDTASWQAAQTDLEVQQNPPKRLSHDVSDAPFAIAVRRAVLASPVARANAASVAASASLVAAEQSALRPQIDLSARMDDAGHSSPSLRLQQLIYDGGSTKDRMAAARVSAQRERENQVAALSAETLATIEAANALEAARQRRLIANQNLLVLGQLTEMISERVSAGAGSNADLTTARSRQTTAASDVQEAEADLARAKALYADLYGESAPEALPPLPEAPRLASQDPAKVLAAAPRLQSERLLQNRLQHEIDSLKARRFPRLAFEVSSDLRQRDGLRDSVQAGLVATLPLSTGGQNAAQRAAAEQRLAAQTAETEALERDLARALQQSKTDIASRGLRLSHAAAAVSVSRQAVAETRAQFDIGRSPVTALLDAQRDLAAAQTRLVSIEASTRMEGWAILGLTGDILSAVGLPDPRDSLILSAPTKALPTQQAQP